MTADIRTLKPKIELPVLFGSAFVTVLLRTLALFFDRKDNGYFDRKIFTGIASGILLAFCAFALLCGIFHRYERVRPADAHSPFIYLPSAFAALTVLLFLYRFYPKLEGFKSDKILHGAAVLAIVFGAFAFVYLFLRILIEAPLSSARALIGLGAALFTGLLAICLYFEKSLPLNHPAKLTDQVALLFASLFFLAEARSSLGRDKVALRTAMTMITALFSAYASFPILLYRAIAGECLSVDLSYALVLCGIFALSAGSLLLSGKKASAEQHPYIQALKESFENREKEISPVAEQADEAVEETADEAPADEVPAEEAAVGSTTGGATAEESLTEDPE